jgi:hypothetical protein
MTGKKSSRWKPGQTGNAKGRPPGQSEITRMRAELAVHVPAIINQLVTAAQAGDIQAARLILERILPPMKAIEPMVEIALPDGEGLTAQGVAIVQAVADGTLAPGQGAQLLTGLGSLARITEIDELEKRITKLEELKNGNA